MKKPISLIKQSLIAIVADEKFFLPVAGTGCKRHPNALYRAMLYSPGCIACTEDAMGRYRKKNIHQDRSPVSKEVWSRRHQANMAMVEGKSFFMPAQYTQCERHPTAAFVATPNQSVCYMCRQEKNARRGVGVSKVAQQAYEEFIRTNKPIPILKARK